MAYYCPLCKSEISKAGVNWKPSTSTDPHYYIPMSYCGWCCKFIPRRDVLRWRCHACKFADGTQTHKICPACGYKSSFLAERSDLVENSKITGFLVVSLLYLILGPKTLKVPIVFALPSLFFLFIGLTDMLLNRRSNSASVVRFTDNETQPRNPIILVAMSVIMVAVFGLMPLVAGVLPTGIKQLKDGICFLILFYWAVQVGVALALPTAWDKLAKR